MEETEDKKEVTTQTAEGNSTEASNSHEDWRAGLPEGLRDSHVLAKYESPEGAFKALIEAQSYLGRKGLVAPVDGATKEQVDAYRAARRGGVDSPEKYAVKMTKSAMEEAGVGADELLQFQKQAFNAGLDNDAFNALMGEVAAERKAIFAQRKQAADDLVAKLTNEWGKDGVEQRLSRSAAFIEQHGLSEMVDAYGLGANEAFVRFIDSVSGKAFGERTLPATEPAQAVKPSDAISAIRKSNVLEKFGTEERAQSLEDYKKHIESMRNKIVENRGRAVF